ncbi:hypothetical protein [uncultured Thiothrix sp.]|uniref:hypothetical protein n=1 Tax=uncultured Thiothrix sp. TaxID=223185 RepID=UPI002612844A|nr:hypothetical protein [uncultured Thiothrix sp.]
MYKSISSISTALLLGLSFNTQAASPITSVYTALEGANCKTLESQVDEGGWYKGRCKGIAGYDLLVMEGDIRQTITVVDPKKKEYPLELWNTVSSGFSSVGSKAEWRVQKQGNKPVPIALIVRFNASEDPEHPEKTTSYLVVSKITTESSCVTDVIKPQANANELARKLADQAANKACK